MTNDSPPATPASAGAAPPPTALLALLRLLRDDSGQDLVEYALIATFIGLSSVAGVHGIAGKIAADMNIVLNGFNNATGQS